MLANLYEPAIAAVPALGRIKAASAKILYRYLARLLLGTDVLFLNYGYAPLPDEQLSINLDESDEQNRAFIQLYHRVVAPVRLKGLDVLEVSCGHGGGAAYLARYLSPRFVTGIDQARGLIEDCQTRLTAANLAFEVGDAECLRFEAARFDAVVNVEASHCYDRMEAFLAEVHRVLRPGGHFFFADYRTRGGLARLRRQFKAAGLDPVREDDITPNVLASLEQTTDLRLARLARLAPRPFHPLFRELAGVAGSRVFRMLESGELVYYAGWLRKLEARAARR